MSLDKTLLTLRALRDGLQILWKLAAFWIFINAWPTRSFAIQNAASFHKIFKALNEAKNK